MNIQDAIKATEIADMSLTKYNKVIQSLTGRTQKEVHEEMKLAGIKTKATILGDKKYKEDLQAMYASPEYKAEMRAIDRNPNMRDGGTALRNSGRA